MDKTDKETHDFMNVESFSQLPFIRPSPLKEKGIRLFGKEFGGGGGGGGGGSDSNSMITEEEYEANNAENHENSKETGENSRKFECHYCCRNFPTSQALGGHQNAHKRERQHAKRAHLQSTMVNGTFSEAHMYGLMNYHRFTTTPPPFYHHTNPNNPPNNITNYNHRFYNYNNTTSSYNTSYHQTPINGSPLALWRSYPNNAQTSTFNRDHPINMSPMMSSNEGTLQASRINTSSSYNMYDSKQGVQDQVSLDLHL